MDGTCSVARAILPTISRVTLSDYWESIVEETLTLDKYISLFLISILNIVYMKF